MYIDDKGFVEIIEAKQNSENTKKECVYANLTSGEWLTVETTYKKVTKDWGDDWQVDTVKTSVSMDKPDEEGKEEKLEKLAEAVRALKGKSGSSLY